MIDTFNRLYENRNYISTLNKFKIQSNNILWLIILEIINILQLDIQIVKVKAHADNNRYDTLTNIAHTKFNELILDLKYENTNQIKWIPTWNDIVIEENFRKFVTSTTNVENLENFLNLNRNSKYRYLNVDWMSPSQILMEMKDIILLHLLNRNSKNTK
jgi:hypothetical protein